MTVMKHIGSNTLKNEVSSLTCLKRREGIAINTWKIDQNVRTKVRICSNMIFENPWYD